MRGKNKRNLSIRICIYSAPSANPFTCMPYQKWMDHGKYQYVQGCAPVLIKMPSPLGKLHAFSKHMRHKHTGKSTVFTDQASKADDRGIHEPQIPVRYDRQLYNCPYYFVCFLAAACVCVRAERTHQAMLSSAYSCHCHVSCNPHVVLRCGLKTGLATIKMGLQPYNI
jgi:hypothetical protein